MAGRVTRGEQVKEVEILFGYLADGPVALIQP